MSACLREYPPALHSVHCYRAYPAQSRRSSGPPHVISLNSNSSLLLSPSQRTSSSGSLQHLTLPLSLLDLSRLLLLLLASFRLSLVRQEVKLCPSLRLCLSLSARYVVLYPRQPPTVSSLRVTGECVLWVFRCWSLCRPRSAHLSH